MKVNLIKIGNSKGIRIPKFVVEQCGLQNPLELYVSKNKIVLESSSRPRAGWETLFMEQSQNKNYFKDFDLLINKFDKDWEWK
jgi:antitoxin MazE